MNTRQIDDSFKSTRNRVAKHSIAVNQDFYDLDKIAKTHTSIEDTLS